MKIELGSSIVWGLPDWERSQILTAESPRVEVEYDSLSDGSKKIVDEGLRTGKIVNPDAPIPSFTDLGTEEALQLPVPEFRVKIITPLIASGDKQTLRKFLATERSTLNRRIYIQTIASGLIQVQTAALHKSATNHAVTPSDPSLSGSPFLPAIEVDENVAQIFFEEEEPEQHNVADLIEKFEAWADENKKEKDQPSFQEYMEQVNARSIM